MRAKKIFVVDDDEDARDAMTMCLEDAGYLVTNCVNGQETLDFLKKDTCTLPHLILLDLMMPVMDGFQFREIQLADTDLCHIPVIVLSAGNNAAVRNDLFKDVPFMSKPFELGDLLENITNILS